MSDPENFVARWSRLKRKTGVDEKETPDEARPAQQQTPATPGQSAVSGKAAGDVREQDAAEAPFDISKLPPIESITSATDIRQFLQSGVPAELTKAALRRAWTSDPEIRDFIGLAENQWDFTDPTAIPGFGPLGATDDVGQLVSRAMDQLDEMPKEEQGIDSASPSPQESAETAPSHMPHDARTSEQVAGMPEGNADRSSVDRSVEDKEKIVSAASQYDDDAAQSATVHNRRGHGRALPR